MVDRIRLHYMPYYSHIHIYPRVCYQGITVLTINFDLINFESGWRISTFPLMQM